MPELSRRQFAAYLIAVVLVVLLGGRALRAAPPAAPAGAAYTAGGEPGTGPSGASGATEVGGVEVGSAGQRLVVHVAGRVRRPGVYELAEGARIADALAEAGGGRPGADLDVLNLAAKVTDGQQVLVARRGKPASAAGAAAAGTGGAGAPGAGTGGAGAAAAGAASPATAGASGAKVNINSADVTQLEALTGVGPAIAAKIVDYRTQNGPFKAVDDLALVSGIGPKTLEGMRAQAGV